MPNGGFWTAEMLAERQASQTLITPYETKHLERMSYNLSVGEEIYVSPASEADSKTKRILKPREACVIPPGQFALLTTAQTVRVPADAVGFIGLRSKGLKFRGLVNVSGFYVEPGYDGLLIFTVFNAGPAPIQVACGDRWFEIFFSSLAAPSVARRQKTYFDELPSELITPLSHQFLSLPGMDAKITDAKKDFDTRLNQIEREHGIARWAMGLILAALVGLAVRACSLEPPRAEAPRAHAPLTSVEPLS